MGKKVCKHLKNKNGSKILQRCGGGTDRQYDKYKDFIGGLEINTECCATCKAALNPIIDEAEQEQPPLEDDRSESPSGAPSSSPVTASGPINECPSNVGELQRMVGQSCAEYTPYVSCPLR